MEEIVQTNSATSFYEDHDDEIGKFIGHFSLLPSSRLSSSLSSKEIMRSKSSQWLPEESLIYHKLRTKSFKK